MVFVAHRKISFVSCMVGLPIVCSIWCVVCVFPFLAQELSLFVACCLNESVLGLF